MTTPTTVVQSENKRLRLELTESRLIASDHLKIILERDAEIERIRVDVVARLQRDIETLQALNANQARMIEALRPTMSCAMCGRSVARD